VTREAGPVKGGSTVIAFVKDPSGYLWELLQRGGTPEPLCQVIKTGIVYGWEAMASSSSLCWLSMIHVP
jgi:hypothetical protein